MTFYIASADPRFDESQHARAVARAIGSEHIEEVFGEENLFDVLDVALGRLDEPLADPSYLPTFLLSRLASAHVKVVLGGDGGDELFGGYPTYRAHRYARLWRMLPFRKGPLHTVVAGLRDRDGYQSARVEGEALSPPLGRQRDAAPLSLDVEPRPRRPCDARCATRPMSTPPRSRPSTRHPTTG